MISYCIKYFNTIFLDILNLFSVPDIQIQLFIQKKIFKQTLKSLAMSFGEIFSHAYIYSIPNHYRFSPTKCKFIFLVHLRRKSSLMDSITTIDFDTSIGKNRFSAPQRDKNYLVFLNDQMTTLINPAN